MTVKARQDVAAGIASRIDELRASRGLRPLARSAKLTAAAAAHAGSMGSLGFLSHTSADGTSLSRRIARYYPRRSKGWTVGENIYFASPEATPAEALPVWLASPAHRANLLRRGFAEVGVSVLQVAGAPGVYGGENVTIVVADFGASGR